MEIPCFRFVVGSPPGVLCTLPFALPTRIFLRCLNGKRLVCLDHIQRAPPGGLVLAYFGSNMRVPIVARKDYDECSLHRQHGFLDGELSYFVTKVPTREAYLKIGHVLDRPTARFFPE